MQKFGKMFGGFALGTVILVGGILLLLEMAKASIPAEPRETGMVVIPSITPANRTIPTITPAVVSATDIPATEDSAGAIWRIADGVIIGEIQEVLSDLGPIVIKYEWARVTGYSVGFAEDEMAHLACELRAAGYTGVNYQFHALAQYNDGFGNLSYGDGLTVRLLPDAIAAMNCDNYAIIDIRAIAQFYELAEQLR